MHSVTSERREGRSVIVCRESVRGVAPEQLTGLSVGWPNRPLPETHLQILARSDHVVLAVDDETGRAVGSVNAITGGVLCACIPLLDVVPTYQGQGIGTALVQRMLDRLGDPYAVDLMCDPDVEPLSEQLGMHRATG